MHRIDGPGATVDNKFTDGDPVGGIQATLVTDDWLNDVQENIMAVLAAAGIAPTKGRAADLKDAIQVSTSGRLLAVKVFIANGTYTPTPGMRTAFVRAVGGGGGSAGLNATAATQYNVVGGGGSAGYAESLLTAAAIGASQAVTIGAGGTAGGVGLNGGNGGTTSLGSLLTVPGGQGSGPVAPISTATQGMYVGGDGGAAPTTGNILNTPGAPGCYGLFLAGGILGGDGGSAVLGAGGKGLSTNSLPNPGGGYGSGAGGSAIVSNTAGHSGAAGSGGILIVMEYS